MLERNHTDGGHDGSGIDIALIDSGVAPVDGLDGPHVLHGPDLSFEGESPEAAYLDTYGHGTHMAGILAGRRAGHQGLATGSASRSPTTMASPPCPRSSPPSTGRSTTETATGSTLGS